MTLETPFRTPSAPEKLKRISPHWQFIRLHTKANTESAEATARGAVLTLCGLAFTGGVSFLVIPVMLSHIGQDTYAGACLCKMMPHILVLLITLIASACIVVPAISKAGPPRKEFKQLDGILSKVQDFNLSIIHMNLDIREFDKYSYKYKLALVELAIIFSGTRKNILAELEAMHD